ncbi:MAG: DUF6962 family protein [Flavobacteriales bacterium]
MEIITFEWIGLQLQEPMSLILDWLLAAVCFFSFVKIRSFKTETEVYTTWWAIFFLFMGASMFTGGLAHFFSFYAELPLKIVTWSLSAIAVFSAEMASLSLFGKNRINLFVKTILSLKLLAIVLLTFWFFDFGFIKINSTVGMVGIVLFLHAYKYFTGDKQKSYILIGVGIIWTLFPALVHAFNINLHLWFNRDDFAHILMIFTFYLFYRGVSYQGKRLTVSQSFSIPQST